MLQNFAPKGPREVSFGSDNQAIIWTNDGPVY